MMRNSRGFTIIEVIIVLAIAGMIIAIIFGAFPAFNRNSHNSQRKQDVTAILDAVSHYELNNSGNMPPDNTYLQYTKLSVYGAAGSVTLGSGSTLAAISGNTNLNTVKLYNYQKCDITTPGGSSRTGAGYNDVVALYAIETSNATSAKCQQL